MIEKGAMVLAFMLVIGFQCLGLILLVFTEWKERRRDPRPQ